MSTYLKKTLLVHNIGHHDLFLLLDDGNGGELLVKAKNVYTFSFSEIIFKLLSKTSTFIDASQKDLIKFTTPIPYAIPKRKVTKRLLAHSLSQLIDLKRYPNLYDLEKKQITILGFKLPLIVPIIDTFIEHSESADCLHVLLLSAGATESGSDQGRTTKFVAEIIKYWIHTYHSKIGCDIVHNSGDPFKYNGKFLKLNLIPRVEKYRYELSADSRKWAEHFTLYLSINTGTIPVMLSLIKAFADMKPVVYHISSAKMWPDHKAKKVEVEEYDAIRQSPKLTLEEVKELAHFDYMGSYITLAIDEMKKWKDEFLKTRPNRPTVETAEHDEHFFFRKGVQEVLAVLVVAPEGKKAYGIRGVNIEVSLPTGTLCAERNAVGSALVKYPDLKRQDIKAVAVLRANPEKSPRLGPCGACKEWLRKVDQVNPTFRVVTFADHDCDEIYIDRIEQV